jgi:hypothetical protein
LDTTICKERKNKTNNMKNEKYHTDRIVHNSIQNRRNRQI